jgi:transposase
MLDARGWAEIRRMREVEGLSIHEIARRTGHDRNTVRRALRREGPPAYRRPPRPSKLDPHLEGSGRCCGPIRASRRARLVGRVPGANDD